MATSRKSLVELQQHEASLKDTLAKKRKALAEKQLPVAPAGA